MRLISLIVAVGLAACVTPSIPIPPPDPTQIDASVSSTTGKVSLTYPPTHEYIGGVAYVYNRSQGAGIIENVNPDGSVGPTPEVAATLGDNIVFSVEVAKETVSTCFVLREGQQDPNVYCQ